MAPLLDPSTPPGVFADAGAASLTTATFTPPAGSLIVVKGTASSTVPITSVTGAGLTFTRYTVNAPASHCSQSIWVATGNGTSVTVKATWTSAAFIGMFVEVWTGAQLAATPATHVAQSSASGAPSDTITTAAAGSVVTWIDSDWVPVSGATRTYRSGAVETFYHLDSGQFGMYTAYQAAPTVGSQTYGLTAPTGQVWTLSAIELQAASTPASTGTATASWHGVASAVGAKPVVPIHQGTATTSWIGTASAVGVKPAVPIRQGTATTAWAATAAATGSAPTVPVKAGTGTTAWHAVASATGAAPAVAPAAGTAANSWHAVASAVGAAPAVPVAGGAATTSWAAATSATGTTPAIGEASGSATTSWAAVAVANGQAPLVPVSVGQAVTAWAATATAVGGSRSGRDLRILATTVPTLAWTANGPTTAWTTGLPAQPVLATTSPATAWTTSTPEH